MRKNYFIAKFVVRFFCIKYCFVQFAIGDDAKLKLPASSSSSSFVNLSAYLAPRPLRYLAEDDLYRLISLNGARKCCRRWNEFRKKYKRVLYAMQKIFTANNNYILWQERWARKPWTEFSTAGNPIDVLTLHK
uniref:Uncharacterized protein n=1 Tax=Romanomermis culicivorax TaxID=13658 RepID=A0A915KNS4_ROMCU